MPGILLFADEPPPLTFEPDTGLLSSTMHQTESKQMRNAAINIHTSKYKTKTYCIVSHVQFHTK